MHSKDLVVILGEIARAGQDHYSAMHLSSFIGEAVVMLCIFNSLVGSAPGTLLRFQKSVGPPFKPHFAALLSETSSIGASLWSSCAVSLALKPRFPKLSFCQGRQDY